MMIKNRLPSISELKEKYPISDEGIKLRVRRDNELKRILSGEDDRFMVIAGPCSADRESSVMDYVSRLCRLSEKVSDRVFIIPRVYTAKPRTAGGGYKGILHQPVPGGETDITHGLELSRKLHAEILNDIGITSADELLYPETYEYLGDILGYTAIGARSAENQYYRLIASGIDIPVGFKNPTSGNITDMLNAAEAAQMSGEFILGGYEMKSDGNPYAHCILRGGTDLCGNAVPNYGYESLVSVYEKYQSRDLKNPAVIVDANHSNSGKNHLMEPEICLSVCESRRKNPDIKRLCKGVMMESYIESGAQGVCGNIYGKSITDPCIGWDETEKLILKIADLA